MLMLRRSGGTTEPGEEIALPSTRISPASGSMKPAIILSVVVLPHPEGPSRQMNSPCSTARLMPSTDVTAPYFLVRSISSRCGIFK